MKLKLHHYVITQSPPLYQEFLKIEVLLKHGYKGLDTTSDSDQYDRYSSISYDIPSAMGALADAFEALIGAVYLDCGGDIEIIRNIIRYVDMLPQLRSTSQSNL